MRPHLLGLELSEIDVADLSVRPPRKDMVAVVLWHVLPKKGRTLFLIWFFIASKAAIGFSAQCEAEAQGEPCVLFRLNR